MFGNCSDAGIFDRLSLPTLEVLSVSITIPGDDFRLFSFLARSSPPLQELVLGLRYDYLPIQLHQSLHLIPGLGRLELDGLVQSVADLFAALADSPSLFPNLHSLTVFFRWSWALGLDTTLPPFFSDWWTLLRLLSTRPIKRLIIFNVADPPVDVLAAFRELVAGGVQINIGDRHRVSYNV